MSVYKRGIPYGGSLQHLSLIKEGNFHVNHVQLYFLLGKENRSKAIFDILRVHVVNLSQQ